MLEAFDIGPLSWVKDEIDQSLKKVQDSFIVVTEEPEKFASLRFTIAHLYQVSGALDMVGLEGCKRYCSEIEKLTSKLEKKLIPVSNTIMEALMRSVDTLSQYLQDLLNGMPDIPTRLFESLKHLVEIQGETIEISDLFFPDTSYSAPKDLPFNPIAESAVPIFIAEKRAAFQKSFLEWLRTKDADALNNMREAILNVQQVQKKSAQKTLWWAATAFIDGLAQEKVSELSGAKKLCRKLDQQLRNMSIGEDKVQSQLLHDVLYYVAISDRNSDVISSVKNLFKLDEVLPVRDNTSEQSAVTSDAERAALAQLNAELPSLKELWSSISANNNFDGYKVDLETIVSKFNNLNNVLQSLKNKYVHLLFNLLYATAQALQADRVKINENSLIEVAASLNLLEYIGKYYQQLDVEALQKITTQSDRLQAVIDGVKLLPAIDEFATAKLDANVVDAVAKQIISSLQPVEKALDKFFRNPDDITVLEEVNKPLHQITAAFDMLEMPTAKSIALLSTTYVERFKNKTVNRHPNISQFELLAESLSMLGLFAEELPNIRPESEMALLDALNRLAQGVKNFDLTVELSKVEGSHPVEVSLAGSDKLLTGSILPTAETITNTNSNSNTTLNIASYSTLDDVTDKAIDDELQDIFLAEAEEVLVRIAQNLQALRVNATNSDAFAEVRRAYHTLKGSGRTVGLVGMSKVAWSVEKLLNLVMEHKAFPTAKQLVFIEKVSAAFARCVAHLQADKKVTLNPTSFQRESAELELEFENSLALNIPKAQKEEVLIGGTRKLGLAFFNIFLGEAQQHLETLTEAHKALQVDSSELPSDASCRAAHTLGSNALTAGFKPTGDLARALENWLDEHTGIWTEQHLALYENVIRALGDGLEKAKALKNPKSTRALIFTLSESTAAMQAIAAKLAEEALLELEHRLEPPLQIIEKPVKSSKSKATGKALQALESAINEVQMPDMQLQSEHDLVSIDNSANSDIQISKLKDLAVDQELLGLFVEEARELVPQVGRDLRGWRANPHESEYPDSLQRALHTLKGSARMAGQSSIGDSVHSMEDLVIRALKHKVTSDDFDEMFVEFDRIGYMLEDVAGGVKINKQDLNGVANIATPTRSTDRKSQYLRMRADVLDRLINEAGEVSIMRSRMDRELQNFKQSSTDLTDSISRMRAYLRELEIEAETQMQSRMSLLQEANETFDPLEFDRFTRLQELTRMMAESVNDVATIQHGLLLNLDQTDAALQQQNRMNRELQKGLMGVRMLPFATISERLQRIVRQTARELDKRVEMNIEGEEIELDRGVLDKMGAPLEHLLRNAVAHGLESTEERIRLGKPEGGQIKLKVTLENDEITLVITDDGSGINLDKVKQKAIEKGLFTAEQELSDQALMAIIFEPGFSTADTVTQISGRGVGLDAVRSDIAALSGRIDVSNIEGMGAMFNIYLPVTLSVAQVVMARIGKKIFAIPSVMVEQVQKIKQNELISAYQKNKVEWASREYPLHFLAKLVGDAGHVAEHHTYTPVILLRSGTYRSALHVDEVIGNQEVVMKQMGTQLAHVPGMIGATVLGDGSIVLVINPVQLAYREALSKGAIKITTFAPVVESVRKVVLIVDDSLTMRKVLSRVLERENFEVITANDGIDAIQKLQLITPDIILTDIEMPRMDGFEFSRHVRDNEATSNIPLIVISSRTAEKHRNFAKQLGINAFLGKPVQDDELIEQVNALVIK